MEVEHTCPECGGNARMEDVKLCLWKAERLIVIEDINALVCDGCVEQFYDSLTRYKIDRLGENGFPKEEARRVFEVPVFSVEEVEHSVKEGAVEETESGEPSWLPDWSEFEDDL